MASQMDRVVVIGAGMGGLAATLRLAHAGFEVTLVEETQLENLCRISDDPMEMANMIKDCFLNAFTEKDIEEREASLSKTFNNLENAKKLMALFNPTT